MAERADVIQRVIAFWFADPGAPGSGQARPIWFEEDPAFDEEVRARFTRDLERAAAGELDRLTATPEGCLALVILIDQFPRNMFRGTPKAFETDAKAREVANSALARDCDRRLTPVRRQFLYMPFQHSESLADQDRSVALFRALGDQQSLDYALRHRDAIARFGRFPHRNAVLGRASTPEERAFLARPDSSF